jgi:hypothetical protein
MFTEMIQGGFSPISFDGLIKCQGQSHSMITSQWRDDGLVVFCSAIGPDGQKLGCLLDTTNLDHVASITKLADLDSRGFINSPIIPSEVRFYTHDFADASTWSGRTCGDPAAFYVGGVTLHPLVGLWLDATGAGMLSAYGNPAATGYYRNPQVLYGALEHLIVAQYDDVNFRWVDNLTNSYLNDAVNHVYVNYCWLDSSPTVATETLAATSAVWRDGTTNAVVCQFDSTQGPDQVTNGFVDATANPLVPVTKKRGSWMGKDSSGNFSIDTTSSRWRIDPYDDSKIKLIEVGLTSELTADFKQGVAFRWKPYGKPSVEQTAYLESVGLSETAATLPFEGSEYIYNNIASLRFGCNSYKQSTSIEQGCKTPTISMAYRYTDTVTPYLDSLKKQRLDIMLDNHIAIEKTFMARGTFLALQYPSL